MNKSVRLNILGNNTDAKAKLDQIEVRAEELAAVHPELKIGIDTAAAQAKLKVLRDELAETEVQSEGLGKAWEVSKYALLGLGAGLAYGVVKASSFQAAMERVHTQAGVAQNQIPALTKGILALAGQVGEGPNSLAESLYHVESAFASLGISGPKALSLVKIAAEGAKVGGADLVDVTNALGAAIASGIPGVQNYGQAMGALNAIVGSGDMHMQDLADAMGTGMVAVVKGFGLSLNDVGAALATFGDNNIRGMNAATDLRMAVMALASPAKAGKQQLVDWGVASDALATTMRQHGLLAALQQLQGLFVKNGISAKEQGQVITDMFGKKAGTGLNVLMDQMDRLKSKYPAIEKGANSFGAAVAANNQTASQQFARLKDGADALAISMGLKLLPAAIKVTGWLANFVNALNNGSIAAQGVAGVIGAILVGIALKKLEGGLKGSIEGFEALWKAGTKAVGFIGDLTGKILGLGGAQTAETAAAEEVAVVNEEAAASSSSSWLASMARQLVAAGAWVAENTVKIALVVGENIAAAATTAAAWLMANAAMMLGIGAIVVLIGLAVFEIVKHWHTIETETKKIWDAVWGFIKKVISDGINFIKSHWELIVGILTGPIGIAVILIVRHWDQIRNGAARMIGDVIGFFERLPGDILNAVGNLGNLLLGAGEAIMNGLLNGLLQGWHQITSFISGVAGWISNHKGPIEVDAVLLRPHGRAIMGGLVGGLQDGMPGLNAQLARTTGTIANTRIPGVAGSGGQLTIEWVGGQADSEFMTWLKRNVRVRGGDPSVFGR